MVDSSYSYADYENSIIEFYSDYWLGCTASKFIVDEFKKENPEVFLYQLMLVNKKTIHLSMSTNYSILQHMFW